MLISLGGHAADATPNRFDIPWVDFVAWLYQHPRIQATITTDEYAALKSYPSKSPEGQRIHAAKDGPYVCLADFGGHRRAYDTLLHSSGIPLDFDSGRVGRSTIEATLAGLSYVAFTTFAHQDEAHRWRVFVPSARPMSADEHAAAWAYFNEKFQGQADPAAKDATRLSYLPGLCLVPAVAEIFHADGQFFQPIPVAPPAPVVLQTRDGPVPGWVGPSDDAELITIACNTRTRPDERFGGPIHFAMLWHAHPTWLGQRFIGSNGQSWDMTQADMALAGELAYWTGGDADRMLRLLHASGLGAARGGDSDWLERKSVLAVERAVTNAKQYHFMGKVPSNTGNPSPVESDPNLLQGSDAELKAACDETVNSAAVCVDGTPVPAGTPSPTELVLANAPPGSSMNDFYAYLPDHTYIHRPSGVACSSASVDEVIGKEARQVLAPTVPVHKFTWAPGFPERFTLDTMDPTHKQGEQVWLYNQYRGPREVAPTNTDVSLWLNLLQRLFPDDADHILNYFADAVQNPGRKCNHALVMGSGVHGTGKDTLLVALQHAVGSKNYLAIKPKALGADFNPFVRNVVVQVSESRDQGDGFSNLSRFEMYEICKDLAAAPPLALECNEKHKGQYPVANVLRLILTTNHQVDGLYMDPNDRRHYCAWSDAVKMTEADANAIYAWYENGGLDAVAHFLRTLDLTARGWNAKATPPRTAWWHQLVAGGVSQEEDKFSDALDKLGRPEWVTIPMVNEAGGLELAGWTATPGNKRKLEREMVKSGYQRLPNPYEKRGRWKVGNAQTIIYRRSDVPAKTLVATLTAGWSVAPPPP